MHWDKHYKGTPCQTDTITHLSCNCGGSDANSTFRQCLVTIRTSDQSFTALALFNTGAYTSFVSREVAKWVKQQLYEGTIAGVIRPRVSRHDIPTSSVGLAGAQLSSCPVTPAIDPRVAAVPPTSLRYVLLILVPPQLHDKDDIRHLSCNCGGTDINSTYRQCLVSVHPSTTFFTALMK